MWLQYKEMNMPAIPLHQWIILMLMLTIITIKL